MGRLKHELFCCQNESLDRLAVEPADSLAPPSLNSVMGQVQPVLNLTTLITIQLLAEKCVFWYRSLLVQLLAYKTFAQGQEKW